MRAAETRSSTLRQFAKFIVVGVLNTAFGYGVFALLIYIGVSPIPALVVTYVVGASFNFMTTGRFVFQQLHSAALLRFIAAYVVVFLVNAGLYKALSAMGLSPLVAQAICLPVMAIFSFMLFKFHVFNPRVSRV
jgi:putative flippase GtrA